MIKKIMDALRAAGITAYLAGQKSGKCTAPYVAVADAGTKATGKTTGVRTYYVTVCAPLNAPLQLRTTAVSVYAALEDVVKRTGEESEEDYDEGMGCRFFTIEYEAICSLI